MGVELVLQVIDRRTGDLTRGSSDLMHLVERQAFSWRYQARNHREHIEISTAVHTEFVRCATAKLRAWRDTLVVAADKLDLRPCGWRWRIRSSTGASARS